MSASGSGSGVMLVFAVVVLSGDVGEVLLLVLFMVMVWWRCWMWGGSWFWLSVDAGSGGNRNAVAIGSTSFSVAGNFSIISENGNGDDKMR